MLICRSVGEALPYFKNDAAVKKYLAVLLSGVEKIDAILFSDDTSLISSTGPQLKALSRYFSRVQ